MSDALEEVTGEVEDLRRRVEERRRVRATNQTEAEDAVRLAQMNLERDDLQAQLAAMDDEDSRKHPLANDPVRYAEALMNEAAGITPPPEVQKAEDEEAAADEVVAEATEERAKERQAKIKTVELPEGTATKPEGGSK